MANPQFFEQKPISLSDVQQIIQSIESRDTELNFLSKKAKEYLQAFVTLTPNKKEKLYEKILALNITRLKEEHLIKIMDYLPKDIEELKVVLQAYPLSLSKKDQEAIVKEISQI